MIQHDTYAVPRADLGEAFHEFDPMLQGLVWPLILPVKGVAKKAATLSVITRENMKRAETKLSKGSAYNRINLISEDLAYATTKHGLEIQLTDDDRENYADDYDAEIESAQALKKKFYNELEIEVATAIFNTTTWPSGTAALYTDNSGSPWTTATTDIIKQITAAIEKVENNTGVSPDALIIGKRALHSLLYNDDIIGRFPGSTVITRALIEANLAAIFGLTKLIVGGGIYDSAKEGQAFSASKIWDQKYAMVAKIQTGSTMTEPGLGRTIIWEGISGADEVQPVLQYREEQTDSDVYKIKQYSQPKIFDAYFAHMMKIETS